MVVVLDPSTGFNSPLAPFNNANNDFDPAQILAGNKVLTKYSLKS
jgi:hypothetical protein